MLDKHSNGSELCYFLILKMNIMARKIFNIVLTRYANQHKLGSWNWKKPLGAIGECSTCRGFGCVMEHNFVTGEKEPVRCIYCGGSGWEIEIIM